MSFLRSHADRLCEIGIEAELWLCDGGSRVDELRASRFPVQIGSVSKLVQALRHKPYDVIHLVNNDPLGDLINLLGVGKIVVTSHGNVAEWTSKHCFAYTAISTATASWCQPLSDLEIEKIPNGVDCAKFTPATHPDSGPPIVAWAGRSRDFDTKDFPRFTRIGALLAKRGMRLWVADAHRASWANFSDRPDCHYTPMERWDAVPFEQMPEFFRTVAASGGVLLVTSKAEGLGLVALEAAACGLTTLAPRVGGLPEAILPGVTGDLFAPDDSDQQVADKVFSWVEQRRPIKTSMENCAAAARQHFSCEAMTQRYVDIYRRSEKKLFRGQASASESDVPQIVLDKFRNSRGDRARMSRQFARELALDGERSLAAQAIWHSVSTWPSSCARLSTVANLLHTAAIAATAPKPASAPSVPGY